MILGKMHLENYGSYKVLDFDYRNLGLTLVSGPTGSGKSTLMDASAWIIFGITSKDTNADDVKSWFAETATVGTQEVGTPTGDITVTRIRGTNPSQNDLYYVEANLPDVKKRGRDANDTQKLINDRIGVKDPELYLISAYIHQFSKSDGFFIAKAKDRRETMEKIADLSLAIRLGVRASDERKIAKKLVDSLELSKSREAGRTEELLRTLKSYEISATTWEEQKIGKIAEIQKKAENFDKDTSKKVDLIVDQLEELDKTIIPSKNFDEQLAQIKQQLTGIASVRKDHDKAMKILYEAKSKVSALKSEKAKLESPAPATCPVCLGPSDNSNKAKHITELSGALLDAQEFLIRKERDVKILDTALSSEPVIRSAYDSVNEKKSVNQRLIDKYETLKLQAIGLRDAENIYVSQLQAAKKELNPFTAKQEEQKKEIAENKAILASIEQEFKQAQLRVAGLTWLYDKSFELRAALMSKAVRQLNQETNRYLEQHFDATLRVQFSLVDSDKLDVTINNSGYPCSYKQLSGGERRMLTLSFSIALMQAAQNRSGVKFSSVMLDESLNGLSDDLKVKAFGLLQELENQHETILVIEHSEPLKELFANRFKVTNVGHSEIRKVGEKD